MTDGQRKICLRAIDHFGVNHQKEKAVEELLELGTEIMHDLDGRARMDAIREELADVIIMAEQLRIIYGGRAVDEWIENKLERLERRIAGEGDMERRRGTTSSALRAPSPQGEGF